MLDAVATIILAGMMFIPIINLVVGIVRGSLYVRLPRRDCRRSACLPDHHRPEADRLARFSPNSNQAWGSVHRLPEQIRGLCPLVVALIE